MIRVAAVDCGTNSLRLLIADVDVEQHRLLEVDRRTEIVRLGEGVDRTGRFDPQALARTLALTAEYAALCTAAGVQRVRFVATSASRDAGNRDEFVAGVQARLGVEPEVISGQEEAGLAFSGGVSEMSGHPDPFLVVDLGGGSTEFVLGGTQPEAACSVDIGSVRLTERYLRADPPTPDELDVARADVDAALDRVAARVPLARARTLVGLAGTVTTITAHALGLPEYQRDRVHHAVLGVDEVRAACASLIRMPVAQRAALPFMHPGRADVIGAGALIWQRVIDRLVREAGLREVITSEHDILDGIAWALGTCPGSNDTAG